MAATRVRELVDAATTQLAAATVPSPRHDAEMLAAHLLGVSRGELLHQGEPDEQFAGRYGQLVARRVGREPLQYITGIAHFRRLSVPVGPGVFIPRPETEVTAGAAIEEALTVRRSGRAPIVADLYAGSGAIALSVAHEVPGAIVHAVEADDLAVGWLRRNVVGWDDGGQASERGGGSTVTVHHSDVEGCLTDLADRVDVVVGNPPYIPVDAHIRDPEVATHDPAAALWSGADGLDAMRVLEQTAARLLRSGGLVVAEHADVQGEAAPAVFSTTSRWATVTDHVDLTDRPRYVTARVM